MYCPWCVGEHVLANALTGVNRDARLSSPCMGSSIGDTVYPQGNWGGYTALVGGFPPQAYTAGQSFDATVILDADHNGEAQWQLCPHSQAQTEECFRSNSLNEWTDVHSYWEAGNTQDHWKSGQSFPQTVHLPATTPTGPATLRWLWVCKYTDEVFTSCIDVNIIDGVPTPPTPPTQATQPVTPIPTTPPSPEPEPEPQPEPEQEAAAVPTPSPTASSSVADATSPCAAHCRGGNNAMSWTIKCSWSDCAGCGDCDAIFQSCGNNLYGQCGGQDWSGATCCQSGAVCQVQDTYYSQCVPADSLLQRERRSLKIQRHLPHNHLLFQAGSAISKEHEEL